MKRLSNLISKLRQRAHAIPYDDEVMVLDSDGAEFMDYFAKSELQEVIDELVQLEEEVAGLERQRGGHWGENPYG